MEKQYTLNTLLGDVTASEKVLDEFICGYFAFADKQEKEGFKALADMYREKACNMFDELVKLTKGGEQHGKTILYNKKTVYCFS